MRVNSGLLAFQPLSFLKGELSLFIVDPKAGEGGHEVESAVIAAAACGSLQPAPGTGELPMPRGQGKTKVLVVTGAVCGQTK